MPITTDFGETPWTAKDVQAATGATVTAATRKMKAFTGQIKPMLDAWRAAEPTARTCDIVQQMAAAMVTGARLIDYNPEATLAWLRELAAAESPAT